MSGVERIPVQSQGSAEVPLDSHELTTAQRTRELLRCCARTRMDPNEARRVHRLIDAGIDWDYLFNLAFVHRVIPLIYLQLKAQITGTAPREAVNKLRAGFLQITRRNIRLTNELLEVLNLFQGAGIPVIPIKGPVLAEQFYGNLAFRQFVDLDLLLSQVHIRSALKRLGEHGYSPAEETAAAMRSGRVPGQYIVHREEASVIFELHSETTLRYFPQVLDMDGLAQRLRPFILMDKEIRTLSAEDTLILLAVHGAKHFWDRLAWLCDLAELTRSAPAMNWTLAMHQAETLGVQRMVLLGLQLTNRLLDAPLPEAVKERIAATPAVVKLGNKILKNYLEGSGTRWGVVQRARFRVQLHRDQWSGIRHVVRLATAPSQESEFNTNSFAGSSLFHAACRPLRLLRKYGLTSGDKVRV